VVLGAVHDPAGRVTREYRAFTQLDQGSASSSRFVVGGGNRYDYWRIAAHDFEAHPVRGVGAGNYDRSYFRERRTTEDVRQAHSIELQTLGELGLVGGGLLLLFVGAVLAGLARRAWAARDDQRGAALAVAAGGLFLVWLIHTSVDWLHLIPGITGIALCAAAVLVGPWAGRRTAPAGRRRIVAICSASVVALFGATLLGRASLAQHYRSEGTAALGRGHPIDALDRARDSLRLDDQSLPTYYLESAAWAKLGRYREARASLLEGRRREPHDFVTWALLGDLAVRRGDLHQARADYARASELNPRDVTLRRLAHEPRSALGSG
jgi:tetratricopeptide (TPR) repeat protein